LTKSTEEGGRKINTQIPHRPWVFSWRCGVFRNVVL